MRRLLSTHQEHLYVHVHLYMYLNINKCAELLDNTAKALNAYNLLDIDSFYLTRSTQAQKTHKKKWKFSPYRIREKCSAEKIARSQRVKSCYAIESCLETDCLYQGWRLCCCLWFSYCWWCCATLFTLYVTPNKK